MVCSRSDCILEFQHEGQHVTRKELATQQRIARELETPPAPRLIGIIKIEIPKLRRVDGTRFKERIAHVAFDTDGTAWGLVEQLEDLGEGICKINYVRWVRFDAIPFEPRELVTSAGWFAAPAVPGG